MHRRGERKMTISLKMWCKRAAAARRNPHIQKTELSEMLPVEKRRRKKKESKKGRNCPKCSLEGLGCKVQVAGLGFRLRV
jgi:hypothetical protein